MPNPVQGFENQASFVAKQGTFGRDIAEGSPFLDSLKSAMNDVAAMQSEADGKVAQLLNGNGQDVHSAMIAVEKANLSFQMMVQVRNKIVQAYQQISAMPF
jgi:flagellar hook-basal body complex protein FliE